jgi:hypothetical protein
MELTPSNFLPWPRGLAVRDDGRVFLAAPVEPWRTSDLMSPGQTIVFELEQGAPAERFRLTAPGRLTDIVADTVQGFYLLFVAGEGSSAVSTVVALDPTYAERVRRTMPAGLELTDFSLQGSVAVGGNVYDEDGGGSHIWMTAFDSDLGPGGRPYPPFVGREGTLSSIQFASYGLVLAGANGNDGWVVRLTPSGKPPGDVLDVMSSDHLSATQQSDGTILVVNSGLFQRWTP